VRNGNDGNIFGYDLEANLTKLTKLELSYNKITDVTPLSGLTNLTELWLWGNKITDDQKHLLMRALPNCNIGFG